MMFDLFIIITAENGSLVASLEKTENMVDLQTAAVSHVSLPPSSTLPQKLSRKKREKKSSLDPPTTQSIEYCL